MDATTPALAWVGIDIGKDVFHFVGFGADGKIAFRRKIKRLALIETLSQLPPCVVGSSGRNISVIYRGIPCSQEQGILASHRAILSFGSGKLPRPIKAAH